MIQQELEFIPPKKRGQRRAVQALEPEYRVRFFAALEKVRANGSPFTIDDLTEIVGLPSEDHRNALGGLMAQAAAEGLIEKVGYAEARRKASHARVISTWRGVKIAPK